MTKVRSIIIILTTVSAIDAVLQDYINHQHRTHLPETKFSEDDYLELAESDKKEYGPATQWNTLPQRNIESPRFSHAQMESSSELSDTLDPSIAWDSHWTAAEDMGQLSAIDLDPEGRIVIFSRRERVWGLGTFDNQNKFDCSNGPIRSNTIIIFDRAGRKILEWGKNMFYLPHGLTIDDDGNYWITDVALHQVFNFNSEDIKKNWARLKSAENEEPIEIADLQDHQSRFNRSILKPSLILGEAFQPGNDNRRFCKPTAVAVAKNGDFFVSDGYCNSRIVKFNKNGETILHWGRSWSAADNLKKSPPTYALFVPHSLALAEDQNLIYVADREDGRVMSYNAQNGTFHREYKHPSIGTKIYAIAYARGKIYAVNGRDVYASHKFHVRGFVIDTQSGNIVSQFGPGRDDMLAPHDIAVSEDGSQIYAVELEAHKTYRFLQDITAKGSNRTNSALNGSATIILHSHNGLEPLIGDGSSDASTAQNGPLVLSIIISAMILVGLCLAIAAIVARCQKRGCLLSVRKRTYWEADRKENFKLSNLLDTRQGKSFKILDKRPNTRDFSKLSTEPETSEDERVEDSLVI